MRNDKIAFLGFIPYFLYHIFRFYTIYTMVCVCCVLCSARRSIFGSTELQLQVCENGSPAINVNARYL